MERRRSENIHIEEQRKYWWLKHNNKYFVLVTDSMLKSAPGLREQLRARYHVENGYYGTSGSALAKLNYTP